MSASVNNLSAEELEITRKAASIWGRKGGSTKSAKKARAVRKNGKKGGRPRKIVAKQ